MKASPILFFKILIFTSLIQASNRPNVIFILADDMGWNNLACYGSDLHETPHLDELANQGVAFTEAYSASPVCTPTRASILTGKDPARLQMTVWREAAAQRRDRKVLEPVTLDTLPTEHLTLAEVLRDAGYFTAHIGKWHLGRAEGYPQPHGFKVNIGGTLWGAPESFFYPYNELANDYFESWRYVPDLEPGKKGDYLTDRLTDKALELIEAKRDEPFFINLWYHSVHTPVEGKPELVEKYKRKILEEEPIVHKNPHLAAMVESMDENVGRIVAKLKELSLTHKTLVIFTSDNGGYTGNCRLNPNLPVTNNSPLRSGKGSCYEGGIRVPLIVRAPGLGRGVVCREPVSSIDFYPTILKLLREDEGATQEVDGVDISLLLRVPGTKLERDTLYFHYPHYYKTTTPVSAVRQGNWKMLRYYEDGKVELYDLASDPAETTDLSEVFPARVKLLSLKLDLWLKKTEAQLPEENPRLADAR